LAAEPREYELVLMLDPGLEDSARDKLADEVRKRIDSDGALKHEDSWGMRALAFEIRQRTEADYRWFRFEAPSELLGQLDHNLKIADGVLRFRIFKVDPGSPAIVPPPPLASSASTQSRGPRRSQGGGRGARAAADEAPAEEASTPPAEAPSAPPGEGEGEPAAAESEPGSEPEPTR
jgi:small subunit ribosomal protein S6